MERGETSMTQFWNAAQKQLVATGTIHNYARMLWGKTLLLWTPDYETARQWMFHLNDKYALDGRDPNSVGGIMWCLGLWDRPWGNKPIWGGIRPMVTVARQTEIRHDGVSAAMEWEWWTRSLVANPAASSNGDRGTPKLQTDELPSETPDFADCRIGH